MEERKDIEAFIKFLQKFYKYNDKKKNKIIKMVCKQDQHFGNWLQSVRDFNENMQIGLYENLRCAIW